MGLRRFLRDTRAAAAAELALILPAIAFIFLNVADLGFYIFTKMQVDLAAQEAVGAARVLCNEDDELPATVDGNCTGYDTAMIQAAQSTSLGTNVTIAADDVYEAYYCTDNEDGELTKVEEVTAAEADIPDTCEATVTGSTAAPGIYISAKASYNFTPIFPGASVASVLPATITREAWMRLL